MQETTALEAARLEGKAVYASGGEKLGDVEAVFLDKDTRKPEWLALRRRFLPGSRVLVPVKEATLTNGSITVPFSERQVEGAPEVEGEEVSQETERALASHYGLTYSERRSSTGLPEKPRQRSGRKSASTRRRSSRRGGSAEPTRDQLYAEAKRLGVEGRSKMNKQQLARAVGRSRGRAQSKGGSAKANPIEVQKFLSEVGYPTRKGQLVEQARRQRASNEVRTTLERLPDKRFESPTEVSEAIGTLS